MEDDPEYDELGNPIIPLPERNIFVNNLIPENICKRKLNKLLNIDTPILQ